MCTGSPASPFSPFLPPTSPLRPHCPRCVSAPAPGAERPLPCPSVTSRAQFSLPGAPFAVTRPLAPSSGILCAHGILRLYLNSGIVCKDLRTCLSPQNALNAGITRVWVRAQFQRTESTLSSLSRKGLLTDTKWGGEKTDSTRSLSETVTKPPCRTGPLRAAGSWASGSLRPHNRTSTGRGKFSPHASQPNSQEEQKSLDPSSPRFAQCCLHQATL